MSNIFDYLTWRGDLSLNQDPINCVDSLILSRMAYFPFDGIWEDTEDGLLPFCEIAQRIQQKASDPEHPLRFLMPADVKLIDVLAKSKRFQDLKLSHYINVINPKIEKQFSAVTIHLNNGAFVSYRGTDNTLVGWKEDFNMGFSAPVPSQLEAVKYLENYAKNTSGNLYLGGHSKGGNLAVYAGLCCCEKTQKRIIEIYNNDGPGFDSDIVSSDSFNAIHDRINTFVPQSSVVGMLLDHEESYTVVHSTQSGVMQHDLYSWEILGKDFIRLDSTTNGSQFIDRTLKEWVSQMDREQRSSFFDALYAILSSTSATSFSELRADWLKNSGTILRSIKNTDPQTKKLIVQTLSLLFHSAQNNISIFFPKKHPKEPSNDLLNRIDSDESVLSTQE